MSNIRRPGGTIDVRRLGMAVSHPGIDPRVWCSLAIVTAVNVDPDHGPFVDVTLLPSGMEATARVGTELAGGGFGIWAPCRVDDEVVVIAPDGAPANGLIVTRRLWSQADKPADLMVSDPDDVLVQSRDGTNMRLRVTHGQLLGDSPDILLHADDGTTVELLEGGTITVRSGNTIDVQAQGPISVQGGTTITVNGQNINVHGSVGVTIQADGSISLAAPTIAFGGSTINANVPTGGQIVLGSGATSPLIMASNGGAGFLQDLYSLIHVITSALLNSVFGAAGTVGIGGGAANFINLNSTFFTANSSLHETAIVKGK